MYCVITAKLIKQCFGGIYHFTDLLLECRAWLCNNNGHACNVVDDTVHCMCSIVYQVGVSIMCVNSLMIQRRPS